MGFRTGNTVEVDIPLTADQLKHAKEGLALGGINTLVHGWIVEAAAGPKPKKKRKQRRTNTTIERDLEWLAEFEGSGRTMSDFAASKGVSRDTMSKAITRGREERKRRESSARRADSR